jgi:hypothetical protein
MNILKTNVQVLPLKYLHENKGQIDGVPANPRILKDDKYRSLLESLRKDDLTGVLPLKIYKHGDEFVVLGGNMRLKALRELKGNDYAVSCVEIPENTPVDVLRKIVVLDNSTFGEWDFDMLANEWDSDELKAWSVDVPTFEGKEFSEEATEDEEKIHTSEVVVASVSLFGQSGETIVCEQLNPEDAERLLQFVKEQGAGAIIKKLLS